MSWAWARAARSSRAEELEALASDIRTPLPVRRRIGFVAVKAGCGASTVVSEVSRGLASHRADKQLVLTGADPSDDRRRWPGKPHTVRRLPAELWDDPLLHWERACDKDRLSHDLTLTDWGATPLAQLKGIAEHSHSLCFVTPADRNLIQAALDVGTELTKSHHIRLAVVDVDGLVGPSIQTLVRALPLPTYLLRHDRRLAKDPDATPQWREPDALALYQLSAALIHDLTRPRPERGA